MLTPTPPFIRWSLEFECALREETDVTSPEATERQLRVLRSYSDAVHAGRMLDGICFDSDEDGGAEFGFRAEDVLAVYGGAEFIHSQCDGCPANTIAGRSGSALAGCFGLLTLDEHLQELLARRESIERLHEVFLPTTPAWYGLWVSSPLTEQQCDALAELFVGVPALAGLFRLEDRLNAGLQRNLHVQSFPAGAFDAHQWVIHSHCPRCKGPMTDHDRRCAVCGLVACAEPERVRKPRGRRPFVPLTSFLGDAGAKELIERYRARGKVV
jgi:hypothetical protein